MEIPLTQEEQALIQKLWTFLHEPAPFRVHRNDGKLVLYEDEVGDLIEGIQSMVTLGYPTKLVDGVVEKIYQAQEP